jgi:hypothetical protein
MILAFAFACAPDDVTDRRYDTAAPGDTADADTDSDTDADTDSDTDADVQRIAGDWLSTGENVSVLFANDPFDFVRITAHFGTDASYEVQVTDDQGQQGTLTGTYTTDTSTLPGTITLQQATPTTATASGIWQVSGDQLTYEVVQTSPDYGYVPPTPATGFGTTSGPDIEAGVNVQVYVRQ